MANDTFVMTARQSAELDYAFERNGVTPKDVKWLSEGSNAAIVRQVRLGFVEVKPVNTFALTVNYNRSIEQSVKAGKYDWANDSINAKHFPSQTKGMAEVEIILVKFEKDMESDDVVKQLDEQGLRPAELEELLAFGEKYSDVQRNFPVVALGSVWQNPYGNRYVPDLFGGTGERWLGLDWWSLRWNSYCRFAAVRK